MEGTGFEPVYAMRADLQSAAFNHSATPPRDCIVSLPFDGVSTLRVKTRYRTTDNSRSALIVTKQKGRKRPNENNQKPRQKKSRHSENGQAGQVWLWGIHAVQAALENDNRKSFGLKATANAIRKLDLKSAIEVSGGELGAMLPPGAVHQGVAMQVAPLKPVSLQEVLEARPQRIAVLDQISDPHNLGAVMRSAAAFGVEVIILQNRHSPPITGVVAKAAAGAVEGVGECRVVNVARALDGLTQAGYTAIGLAGGGEALLGDVIPQSGPVALVFGAEGAGLRPAVAKACTWLAKIPISSAMESLNISNAAAIAFYEMARQDLL